MSPHKCIRFSHLSVSHIITKTMGSKVTHLEPAVVPANEAFVSLSTHPGWAKPWPWCSPCPSNWLWNQSWTGPCTRELFKMIKKGPSHQYWEELPVSANLFDPLPDSYTEFLPRISAGWWGSLLRQVRICQGTKPSSCTSSPRLCAGSSEHLLKAVNRHLHTALAIREL